MVTRRNGDFNNQTPSGRTSRTLGVHDHPTDYDEIDQIYDYVRGFAPLPQSAKGWQYFAEKTVKQQQIGTTTN